MHILSGVDVRMPTFDTCDEWLPVGVGPLRSSLRCFRRVGIRESNGLRFTTLIFADDHGAQVHGQMRLPPRIAFPSDKSLLALRAFEVLRVDVRSLFGRDAMAAAWAGGDEGCANLFHVELATAGRGASLAGDLLVALGLSALCLLAHSHAVNPVHLSNVFTHLH